MPRTLFNRLVINCKRILNKFVLTIIYTIAISIIIPKSDNKTIPVIPKANVEDSDPNSGIP